MSVVNALSTELRLTIARGGQRHEMIFRDGEPESDLAVTGATEESGTEITFAVARNLLQNRLRPRHFGASPARIGV